MVNARVTQSTTPFWFLLVHIYAYVYLYTDAIQNLKLSFVSVIDYLHNQSHATCTSPSKACSFLDLEKQLRNSDDPIRAAPATLHHAICRKPSGSTALLFVFFRVPSRPKVYRHARLERAAARYRWSTSTPSSIPCRAVRVSPTILRGWSKQAAAAAGDHCSIGL